MPKLLMLMVAALMIGGCSQHPPECNCPAEVAARLSGLRTFAADPALAKRVLQCTEKEPCTIDVPVTAVGDECEAALPYCVVCVRRGNASGGSSSLPVVRWQLTVNKEPTTAYAFDANVGINIPLAGASGKVEFYDPGHDGSKSKFKWQAGPDSACGLSHVPTIYNVKNNKFCTFRDPIIVNTN